MSDFIKNDIASRFSQRIQQRVAGTRSGRFDLKLSDWEITGNHEARIMVAYSKEMGFPKRTQLDEWVTSSFNGNLRLVLETLRNYPDYNVVTAFVRKQLRKRPIKHVNAMLAVGKNSYMDDEKTVWEVLTSRDGERYLARAESDDLGEILALRQAEERTASVHHRLRLAHLVTAGVHSLEPGDRVRFHYEGIIQQGEVGKVGKENVTVKANGKSVTVDSLNILDVYEKAPKAKAEQRKFLVDFFTRAYGDKAFAEKFVNVGD